MRAKQRISRVWFGLIAAVLLTGCASGDKQSMASLDTFTAAARIEVVLNTLHQAAATADEEIYFSLFTPEAIFLGTDATERWTIDEFRAFALPYFDGESAWTYEPVDRNVTLLPGDRTAFFDEILSQEKYGECRGSGVLRKIGSEWRIAQYHLTFPIPNEIAAPITQFIQDRRAGTRWVFVLRHAEKGGEGKDPQLSPAGRARAQRLALVLGDLPVTHTFASEYQRTIETVTPLATAAELEVTSVPARQLADLMTTLDELPAGSIAVVAGHSNTVPMILERLGVSDAPKLGEKDFGDLFGVRRSPGGIELIRLQF